MTLSTDEKTHLRNVRLDLWERSFLEFVADRESRVNFDYSKVKIEVKNKVLGLIEKQLLWEELTYQGVVLRLTDQGRMIVDYIKSITLGHKKKIPEGDGSG